MTNYKKGQTPKLPHYAALRTPNGDYIYKEPKNGTDFSLEELQEFVGGCIEIIHLGETNLLMVVHEEGKLLDLPINKFATALFQFLNRTRADYIVGNALVCEECLIK